MINLLSETAKQIIYKEYYRRRAVVALSLSLCVLFCFTIFFLPVFLLSRVEAEIARENRARQVVVGNTGDIKNVINDVNEKILFLSHIKRHPLMTELITLVMLNKNNNILFSAFSYTPDIQEFVVRGVAQKREDLLSFVEFLRKEKIFSQVYLPINQLTRSSNISFSLTASIVNTQPQE